MTEQEYDALAAACDALLRAPGSTLARVALPLLHVLNEHPSLMARYEPLLSGSQRRQRAPEPGADRGRNPRGAVRALGNAVRRRARSRAATVSGAPAATDVLIVSRLARAEQWGAPEDFYVGAMQAAFARLGARCVLALVDHVG